MLWAYVMMAIQSFSPTGVLRIYWAFIKIAFNRQASFRLANFSSLFTNAFFLLFRIAVFQAFFAGIDVIAGLTLEQTLTYTVLVQSLIMVVPQWGDIGISEDIRSGQIAMDLLRPINYYWMVIAREFGRCVYYVPASAIPILLLGTLFGYLSVLPSIENFCMGMFSVIIGMWLVFSVHFLVELSAFWLESSRGPKRFVVTGIYFLSGSALPIAFFPEWAKLLNSWLPFQYTLNTPVVIFIGGAKPLAMLGVQLTWALVMSLVCMILLRYGKKKVALHGG